MRLANTHKMWYYASYVCASASHKETLARMSIKLNMYAERNI